MHCIWFLLCGCQTRCWQEQQLSSHRGMYHNDGHECDRDGIARNAVAQTSAGIVSEVKFFVAETEICQLIHVNRLMCES